MDEVHERVSSLLPDLASSQLPDGEYHTFACEVRDEVGAIVYRGNLTYTGERGGG